MRGGGETAPTSAGRTRRRSELKLGWRSVNRGPDRGVLAGPCHAVTEGDRRTPETDVGFSHSRLIEFTAYEAVDLRAGSRAGRTWC